MKPRYINITHFNLVNKDKNFNHGYLQKLSKFSSKHINTIIKVCKRYILRNSLHTDLNKSLQIAKLYSDGDIKSYNSRVFESWVLLYPLLLKIKELDTLHDGKIPGTSDTFTFSYVDNKVAIYKVKTVDEIVKIKKMRQREFVKKFNREVSNVK